MPFFHGSNLPHIDILDPNKGVFEPSPFLRIFPEGVKVHRSVVWGTADFEVATAFAMKGIVDDLMVDAESQILYLEGERSLEPTDVGYVYTIDDSEQEKCVAVNAIESFSDHTLKTNHCQQVSPADFKRYLLEWGMEFPFDAG